MVTFDLSARNLHLLRSDHWLSDPRNVALLWLQAPAYGPELPPPPTPVAQMEAWSVSDVVAFFESKDARALGQKLEASSVTAADLWHLSVDNLQHALSPTDWRATYMRHPLLLHMFYWMSTAGQCGCCHLCGTHMHHSSSGC